MNTASTFSLITECSCGSMVALCVGLLWVVFFSNTFIVLHLNTCIVMLCYLTLATLKRHGRLMYHWENMMWNYWAGSLFFEGSKSTTA